MPSTMDPFHASLARPNSTPIAETRVISAFGFWMHCLFHDEPLLIRGGAAGLRVCQTWSLDYLRALLGDAPVTLAKSSCGVFDYNANATTGPVTELENVPFAAAVDTIRADQAGSGDYSYIQQHAIAERFPRLLRDVERPTWLGPTKFVREVNLWVGSAGCFSPLHFDDADNFLLQVQGRKRLTLFSKGDVPYLYPNVGQRLEHCSEVDLRCPDHDRFPLFKRAQPYTALLEPGDVIYIPRLWWHAVLSLDTAISLNYWWGGPIDALREGGQLLREGAGLIWTASGRREIVAFFRALIPERGAGKSG